MLNKPLKNEFKSLKQQLKNSDARFIEFSGMIENHGDEIENLKKEHQIIERKFIDGAATLDDLQRSQAGIDSKIRSLNDLERLMAAAESARKKLEVDVIEKQKLVNANRVDHCFDVQRQIFEELKTDKKFKQKILEAVAAGAANGHVSYVAEYYAFCQVHGTKFIPEFSREELNQATEKFIKDNDLD